MVKVYSAKKISSISRNEYQKHTSKIEKKNQTATTNKEAISQLGNIKN